MVVCVVFVDGGVGLFVDVMEEDWYIEYLVLVFVIKVVDGFDVVIEYINYYGLYYMDVIVIEDYDCVMWFLCEVDLVSVMVNVLMCFVDGFEFGFGVEIGILNDKLYVCGLVGLEGFMLLKYVVFGYGEGC